MKNSFYLILLLCFIWSCSSDDDSSPGDDGGGNTTGTFVKKISNDPQGIGGEIFHYNNDKLKAIEYPCYNIVRYFTYGASNKVSDEYRFRYENFDINSFNLENVINDPETSHKEYVYENNRLLVTKNNQEGYLVNTNFAYNESGLLKNMVVDAIHVDSYIFSYENDRISSIFVSDETGDSYVLTFNLDDKINPFNQLFRQYGITGSDGCNSYYNYMFVGDFPLFENNIINRFVDNSPRQPATYVYNENELPEAISYDGHNGTRYTHFFSY